MRMPMASATADGSPQPIRLIRRMAPKAPKNPSLEWVPLVEGLENGADPNEPTIEDLRKTDKARKHLLGLARSTSAIDTLIKLNTLPRTVLPRLAKKPLIWLMFAVFAAGATAARSGWLTEEEIEQAGMLDTMVRENGTMVTFMVVFYVGYCYTRNNEQFDDVQAIMHAINGACLSARGTFSDPEEAYRLWRYLNLLHASAYCGLTKCLSENNFFSPLVEKYSLLGTGAIQAEERAAVKRIKIDENGSRACAMFEVWAFEVVKGEARRSTLGTGDLSPPIQAALAHEINTVGTCIKRLFAYRYQVMPFIYTHLVSLSCFVYLMASAFLAGVSFTPGTSLLFGFAFPLVFVLTKIIATFGLIEVGETILDPFGEDPEDFALLHFVEVTICSSHEAIEIEPCGPRLKDRTSFYDPKELLAAQTLLRAMIKRWRWKKIIQHARAKREFELEIRRKQQQLLQQRAGNEAKLLTDIGEGGTAGERGGGAATGGGSGGGGAKGGRGTATRKQKAKRAGPRSPPPTPAQAVAAPPPCNGSSGASASHAAASSNGACPSNGAGVASVEHPGRCFGSVHASGAQSQTPAPGNAGAPANDRTEPGALHA